MRSTGKGVPGAPCPGIHLEKQSVALTLWQDVGLPQGWELLPFPADPASSPRGGGVSSAQKNCWSGKRELQSCHLPACKKQNPIQAASRGPKA